MKKKKKYYLFEMNGILLQILSLIILAFMIFLTILLFCSIEITSTDFDFLFLFTIPYLMLHEILHSIAYVFLGANFKNITYGAYLEKGILCCLCKQNISKTNILTSLLVPFLVIGVITYIIGILMNNVILILLSIVNISGCSADLVMFFDLLRVKDFEYSEYDNPMAFGLYTNQDLSKQKFIGLQYVGDVCELEKNNLKKINISIPSFIVIILFLVLSFGMLFFS